MELLEKHLAELCMLGLVFLIRHFFKSIADDVKGVRAAVDKLDGRFSTIQKDVRDNTTETAVTRQEVKALWRFIDHANERASDVNGRG